MPAYRNKFGEASPDTISPGEVLRELGGSGDAFLCDGGNGRRPFYQAGCSSSGLSFGVPFLLSGLRRAWDSGIERFQAAIIFFELNRRCISSLAGVGAAPMGSDGNGFHYGWISFGIKLD